MIPDEHRDPRRWRRYLRFWAPDVGRDVDDELGFHLDMRTRDFQQTGHSPDEARALAAERLGDLQSVSAWLRNHDTRLVQRHNRREWMSDLAQDIRLAFRQFGRAPVFTLVALLTLTLAIGSTTAVFSVIHGVLLKPLPFRQPEDLVQLQAFDTDGSVDAISPLDFKDYQSGTRTIDMMASVQASQRATLARGGSESVSVTTARVGADFFSLLGVTPAHGRFFQRGDDAAGAARLLVLSHASWQQLFGGDSTAIGSTVQLDGDSYTIAGVAAPELTYPAHPDLWVPAIWQPWEMQADNRGLRELNVIARLKPHVTLEQARADVATVTTRLRHDYPDKLAGYRVTLAPLAEIIVGDVRGPLLALLGAVGFVLLIACANIANLLLARATTRQAEMAVRVALGASRSRLVRQLLTESLALSLLAAVAGSVLAAGALHLLRLLAPATLPRLDEIALSVEVLAATAAVAIITGLLFGLAPAMRAARSNLGSVLRGTGRGTTGAGAFTRHALVVTEMGLAVILLVGAGLLIRSFTRLIHADTGFRSEQVVGFDLRLPKSYQYDADIRQFTTRLLAELRRFPGTSSVAVADARPFDGQGSFDVTSSFNIAGRPHAPAGSEPQARLLPVSPDYFRTLGIQIARGRGFTDAEDGPEVAPVIVVNQALVRKYFRDEDPLGHQLTFGIGHHLSASPADSFRTRGAIVGVVDDVKLDALADAPMPTVYVGYGTLPFAVSVMTRTTADPRAIAPAIRTVVRGLEPGAALFGLTALDAAVSASAARPRFYTLLLSAFAAVALLIAALGIYGVIAYTVTQRTRELGIRIALGASQSRIVRVVLGGALGLALAGLGLGIVGAIALTRVLSSMLFEVRALDPLIFCTASVTLLATAVLAAWLPSRRAAAIDPASAIRAE